MPAARILLAAEFPRGTATLSRLLPLAYALADRGHVVEFAVPEMLVPAISDFPARAAPRWAAPPPADFTAASYADILLHGGYGTPETLRALLSDWRCLLTARRPDLLVVDFAPTAMLVAHGLGLPMAAVGDGFSLPPLQAPLPLLRPWTAPPADAATEHRVLAAINECLTDAGVPALPALHRLFQDKPRFLCTFRELDHYPDRAGEDYFGGVFPLEPEPEPLWPAGETRIYVDLDPRHPALPALAAALDRLGFATLIQAGSMPARQADALERAHVQVTTAPAGPALFAGAAFVIGQGLEAAEPALLAGVPVLLLPLFVEQMMTLHRIVSQGLGRGLPAAADAGTVEQGLRQLAADTACRQQATNLARHYDGYRPDLAVGAIADAIGGLLHTETSA